ncbi:MAG TPA: folylpolyglutamate synthase/dihydrofolate synthase family protein [Longimicrobiales bacterium]|nr:folylpolyglutamate synthase/dihydrofolate synthase family protein [Longimicrobiales bacterium]
MSTLSYDALVAELFPRLTGGIRWGLERTLRMLAGVGNPQLRYPALHVGGTNGKGSVAATLASVLHAAGRRVGLYTSPHLCTFRERVQVAGAAIEEQALLAAAERLWPAIRQERPSFFEATTAIALLALAEAQVDAAVIEVGLGGRLDATNVIIPAVCVLTNVSLDHVQYLGSTVEAVAREKAGIIKAGVPVATGEWTGVAHDVFRWRAAEVRAPLVALGPHDYTIESMTLDGTVLRVARPAGALRLTTPLLGAHQAGNVALAVRALAELPAGLRPDDAAIVQGVAAVRWPGRLQRERIAGVPWLLDVAHNVAGVEALVAALGALPVPRPLTAVVGVLGDKDWAGMIGRLSAVAERILLTEPPTAPAERRWDPTRVAREIASPRGRAIPDFSAALRQAQRAAAADGGSVLVTGSFHTVGDALIMLGRCPFGSDLTLPPVDFAV